MPNDPELSDYEVSLLNAFKDTCEESGEPYIHDFELKRVRGFDKSSVMLADMFGQLSSRGFLEQNQFTTNGIPTNWWRMTGLGMAAIADFSLSRRPRPLSSSAPNWVSKLQDLELRNVLFEVYDARENGFFRTTAHRSPYSVRQGDVPESRRS